VIKEKKNRGVGLGRRIAAQVALCISLASYSLRRIKNASKCELFNVEFNPKFEFGLVCLVVVLSVTM
jgi:hypothetical protein